MNLAMRMQSKTKQEKNAFVAEPWGLSAVASGSKTFSLWLSCLGFGFPAIWSLMRVVGREKWDRVLTPAAQGQASQRGRAGFMKCAFLPKGSRPIKGPSAVANSSVFMVMTEESNLQPVAGKFRATQGWLGGEQGLWMVWARGGCVGGILLMGPLGHCLLTLPYLLIHQLQLRGCLLIF